MSQHDTYTKTATKWIKGDENNNKIQIQLVNSQARLAVINP
jgi:hypothetical protein